MKHQFKAIVVHKQVLLGMYYNLMYAVSMKTESEFDDAYFNFIRRFGMQSVL
jgi:hypothetical protein